VKYFFFNGQAGCAIASGAVNCWGYSGTAPSASGYTFSQANTITFTSGGVSYQPTMVAIGSNNSCVIAGAIPSGSPQKVFCWGKNLHGQFASAPAIMSAPTEIVALNTASQIATARPTASNSTCVSFGTGTFCGGANDRAQNGAGFSAWGADAPLTSSSATSTTAWVKD
jgi:hypothetical protein